MLDENLEAFVIYISSFSLESIYPDQKTRIASLLTKEMTISDKYSDFTNILSEKQALNLLKQTKLNQYTIKLQDSKQPSY